MSGVIEVASLDDHGIVVELQLPLSSKRLDCMLTGHDASDRPQAVIVELKQWTNAEPSSIEDCVTVFMGGRKRDVLHPSAQVGGYQRYLLDVHTTFSRRRCRTVIVRLRSQRELRGRPTNSGRTAHRDLGALAPVRG